MIENNNTIEQAAGNGKYINISAKRQTFDQFTSNIVFILFATA